MGMRMLDQILDGRSSSAMATNPPAKATFKMTMRQTGIKAKKA